MRNKKLFASFLIGMLLVSVAAAVEAQAATAPGHTGGQSNTQTKRTNKNKKGREVKRSNVKKVALDAKKVTKDTGKKVGNGGEKAGKGIAKGSKNVAKATTDGASDASKATVKGVKKTGNATEKAAKKVGRVFK
jgi:hypothetical protein